MDEIIKGTIPAEITFDPTDGGKGEFCSLHIRLLNGCMISLAVINDPEAHSLDPRPGVQLWRDDVDDPNDCINDMIGGDHIHHPGSENEMAFGEHPDFSSAEHKEGVRQFVEFCKLAISPSRPEG